jgi:uncharacterized Zn-finger protein
LTDHVRAVHEASKPYTCETCGRMFAHKKALKTHTNIHSDIRPYVCKLCSKAFRQDTTLYSHMKMHKKIEARKEKEKLEENEMEDIKNEFELCDDDDDEQIEDDWDCSVGDEEEGEEQDSNESSCDESNYKKSVKSEPKDCGNDINGNASTKTPLPLPKGPKKVKLNFKKNKIADVQKWKE